MSKKKIEPEAVTEETPPLFEVKATKTVTLTFPQAQYTSYSSRPLDFVRVLTPEPAQELAQALAEGVLSLV